MIGINIGTNSIKIVSTENIQSEQKIVHAYSFSNKGWRHGYINDPEIAFESLKKAIDEYQEKTGELIKSARFSIGGIGLESQTVKTNIEIAKKAEEITKNHIIEIQEKAETLFEKKYPNKKILHLIPLRYSVDGRGTLGSPVGMFAENIELHVIFITILEHHFDSFIELIAKLDIEMTSLAAEALADAQSSLSYRQKTQGAMIINIGSETTSLSTFDNGSLYSLETSNIGSNDITNDLALGLQISLKEADQVKKGNHKDISKKQAENIIDARLGDIIEITERHLKKIKKQHLLPAGVFLTGSAQLHESLENLIKKKLKLAAEYPKIEIYSEKTKRMRRLDSRFTVAYGLCLLDEPRVVKKKKISFGSVWKKLIESFREMRP